MMSQQTKHQRKTSGLKGLVGKYFHSWTPDGDLEWQGQVVDVYGDSHILVLLFDWGWGTASEEKLVPLAETHDWSFYPNAKAMRRASFEIQERQGLTEGTFEEDEAVHDRMAALLAAG
jgi:hypothetical protein